MAAIAPMTFLQLVNKLREKCGAAGGDLANLTGLTGENRRYQNWIIEAWNEIQGRNPNWKWMRKDFSFPTTAAKEAYLPSAVAGEVGISDFSYWHDDTFRLYTTSIGRQDEQYLPTWDYQVFRNTYEFGAQSLIQGRPAVWAERDKDQAILLGPIPDQVYTVTGQYQAAPTPLAADADTPGCPAMFHMVIVYRAMLLYANFEAAPEVAAEGRDGYKRLLAMLESSQLEPMGVANWA